MMYLPTDIYTYILVLLFFFFLSEEPAITQVLSELHESTQRPIHLDKVDFTACHQL